MYMYYSFSFLNLKFLKDQHIKQCTYLITPNSESGNLICFEVLKWVIDLARHCRLHLLIYVGAKKPELLIII